MWGLEHTLCQHQQCNGSHQCCKVVPWLILPSQSPSALPSQLSLPSLPPLPSTPCLPLNPCLPSLLRTPCLSSALSQLHLIYSPCPTCPALHALHILPAPNILPLPSPTLTSSSSSPPCNTGVGATLWRHQLPTLARKSAPLLPMLPSAGHGPFRTATSFSSSVVPASPWCCEDVTLVPPLSAWFRGEAGEYVARSRSLMRPRAHTTAAMSPTLGLVQDAPCGGGESGASMPAWCGAGQCGIQRCTGCRLLIGQMAR